MSRTKIALIAVPAALLLAACSSPPAPTTPRTPATHPATTTTQSTAPAAATSAAAAGLSGTWNGQYSGSFSGTFSLTWQQSGSNLTGTIDLPQAGGSTAINGTVNGSTITFGTVGGQAITYKGSVSGSSMSGTYQLGPGGSGSWSAAKA